MTNLRTGNRDTICRIATNRTKNAGGILAHNRDKVRERHTYIIFRVREGACEQKPLALNSPRSSHASMERPFVEFANPIPRKHGDGLDAVRACRQNKKHHFCGAFYFGDPYGNRTHVFSVRG